MQRLNTRKKKRTHARLVAVTEAHQQLQQIYHLCMDQARETERVLRTQLESVRAQILAGRANVRIERDVQNPRQAFVQYYIEEHSLKSEQGPILVEWMVQQAQHELLKHRDKLNGSQQPSGRLDHPAQGLPSPWPAQGQVRFPRGGADAGRRPPV